MKPPAIRDDIRAFHAELVVVDLHVDVVLQHRLLRYDIQKRHRPLVRRQPLFWHADIPRMIEGGYTAAVLGIHYWPWQSRRALRQVKKQLDYVRQVVDRDTRVLLARTAADIDVAKRTGRLALLAGLEGAHMLDQSLDFLEEARDRGVVYVTLAHFSKNAACTPGLGRKKNQRDGLTPFGRDLVAELNRLGILVDVAHVNRPGVIEACETSTSPVIASHSLASGLRDTPRGLDDAGLHAVAATGGVVGVIFAPNFLRGKLDAPIDAVIDHLLYIADRIGPRHLAIGTDFDGWIPSIPNDIRDCRDLAWLTQRLVDRGTSREDVAGILGGNFLRVLRQVRGA